MNFDQSWLERFRSGDIKAFDALYDGMSQRLFRFCLRLVGDREEAEDVAVQTFAAAHKSSSRFRMESSIETWLFAIAVNQAGQNRRRKRDHERVAEEYIDARAARKLEEIELERLICVLPPRQRIAFLLVKGEGLTYREAAEVMGRRMGTVQSDVFHAVRILRAQMQAFPQMEIGRCGNEV